MKIETFLDSYGVRNMCIAHDYCTCMDNEQYCKMLDWVNETTFGAMDSDHECSGINQMLTAPEKGAFFIPKSRNRRTK